MLRTKICKIVGQRRNHFYASILYYDSFLNAHMDFLVGGLKTPKYFIVYTITLNLVETRYITLQSSLALLPIQYFTTFWYGYFK